MSGRVEHRASSVEPGRAECGRAATQSRPVEGGTTRKAVTDRPEEGMDNIAGSGHRPAVMVGATIHPRENRTFWVASGRTRPTADGTEVFGGVGVANSQQTEALWSECDSRRG